MTLRTFAFSIIGAIAYIPATAQKQIAIADTTISNTYELSEIKVVASKNNAKLKEMPASISIVSAKAIQEMGTKSLSAITGAVPNVFMPDYGSKLTSPIYIRGIGSRINSPSVGLYVDRVPYFEKAAFAFDFFDVEQIEVLRGPQGTLYGRNTMGGIINIITKSPMTFQGTNINLTTGTYGCYNISGGHYGKIGDNFGYSVAINYLHNDGFFKNNFNNSLVDNLNSFGIRNRLVWNINKKLSIENIISYEKSKQGGYPYSQYFVEKDSIAPINYNEYSYYNRDLLSNALVTKYEGAAFEVLSTTAYQYLKDLQAIDQDFSPSSNTFAYQDQKQNMVSQEITIQSKGNQRVEWLFGLYGFAQFFDSGSDVIMSAKKNYSKYNDHTISGYALFHQLTIKDILIKNLNLTAGIRFDVEKDELEYQYNKYTNNIVSSSTTTSYSPLKSAEILPKISLSYKMGQTNIYTTVSKGYKTGGFNSSFDDVNIDLKFKPENSVNYEVGVKSPILWNRFYGDFALFYIDWNDQQITQSLIKGSGYNTTNAGKSISKGLEATLNMVPINGFDASVSYGYTYAKFKKYVVNATTNYNDKYIPQVPKQSLSILIGKTFRLQANSWIDKIRLSANYKGVGNLYWKEDNIAKQGYYGVVDGRISFSKKRINLELWGKNLTNTSYKAYYFEMQKLKFVQKGRPLQLGVTLDMTL